MCSSRPRPWNRTPWQSTRKRRSRPAGRVEKTVKWARRRPALAGLVAVTVLAAAALIGGGLYYNAQLLGKQQQLDRQTNDLAKNGARLGNRAGPARSGQCRPGRRT